MSEENIMSEKVEDISSVTVSATVMAKLLSVTDRRIRSLAEEGVIVKVKRGRYDLAGSIKNYILHIKTNKDIKEVKNEDIDLERERALHEAIKREKTELQVRVMKGELHYAEDVEKVMMDMLAVFRNKVMNIGGKLAPALVARTDLNEVEDIINAECVSALEELASYNPELFYNEQCIDMEEDLENEEDKEKNS